MPIINKGVGDMHWIAAVSEKKTPTGLCSPVANDWIGAALDEFSDEVSDKSI